jgi:phosphoglycolate phosphatase-like HAD superfamily hydrolase
MTVNMLLVLWDIDHTLIENNGVNKETYARAFEMLTERPAEFPASTEGRTEPEIMLNMFRSHNIVPSEVQLERLREVLEQATSLNVEALRNRGHELPGARAALSAFKSADDIVQSVLSGNTRVNALTKLRAFELDGYMDFEVGGYGSDDAVRANLVRFAQERASVKYSVRFDAANSVLIGDTPRDVQAGRDGGAHVVGVASGSDDIEVLKAAGADLVLPDLCDTQAVMNAVTSFRR